MFADEEDERPEGALETAIWCNSCMLPSGVRWPLFDRRDRQIGSFVMCEDRQSRINDLGYHSS